MSAPTPDEAEMFLTLNLVQKILSKLLDLQHPGQEMKWLLSLSPAEEVDGVPVKIACLTNMHPEMVAERMGVVSKMIIEHPPTNYQ